MSSYPLPSYGGTPPILRAVRGLQARLLSYPLPATRYSPYLKGRTPCGVILHYLY